MTPVKSILIIGIVALITSLSATPQKNIFSLTVRVDGFRNSKGVVQFALYNQENSIPDEKYERYYRLNFSEINDGSATISFFDLPKGKYAVNILHDENENGKIDMGFLLPKEGIGFSNYEKINLTNRPKFSKASFQFHKDSTIQIKIIYK